MTAHIRNFRWDDLPALVDFMNAHAEAVGQSGRVTLEQIESRWRAPYNHPEQDAFVACSELGGIIGYAILDRADGDYHAQGIYRALPGQTLAGSALIDAASALFRRAADQRPLLIDWTIPEQDTSAAGLMESRGFPLVRRFYTMRISLESPISPAALPDGFTLRNFTADQLETLHDAYAAAFQDHWNATIYPIDEWRADIAQPTFDPSLWWLAYDGDQLAGFLCANPANDTVGYVSLLGVRRQWRKRGLAYALLRTCFAEFQKRGFTMVDLGVDSDSPTGAVALYERAGMHPRQTMLYFRQSLGD